MADEAYAGWFGSEGVSRKGSGSSEYFQTDRKTGPDAPMSVAIACPSAIGLVEVCACVPYSMRKEVPGDSLDFINIAFVRGLISRLS